MFYRGLCNSNIWQFVSTYFVYRFDDLVMKITKVEMPNHVGSLLSKREFHYVLAYNWTPHMEALLSQWLYLSLCHG